MSLKIKLMTQATNSPEIQAHHQTRDPGKPAAQESKHTSNPGIQAHQHPGDTGTPPVWGSGYTTSPGTQAHQQPKDPDGSRTPTRQPMQVQSSRFCKI